jgi:hypothetical protein
METTAFPPLGASARHLRAAYSLRPVGRRVFFAFFLCAFVLSQGLIVLVAEAATADTMALRNVSGTPQANYPLRFARPFLQGEIANYPVVIYNGDSLPTQADVKQRYSDGSVKHAIISVVIPTLPAGGNQTITFGNQATGNNIPLSKDQMLGHGFNFDATMELTQGGVTKIVSAREMLQNGNHIVWASGPIAQTIILADHSASRTYDRGWDAQRSFRPIFEVTFWPSVSKVNVRFVGENSNTQTLQDIQYDLKLRIGLNVADPVYVQDAVQHFAANRWTKVFWIGGEPEKKVNLNHNLAYLAETKFIPNYDASLNVPDAVIAATYAGWKGPHGIGAGGNWQKAMGTAGGRADIGPMPSWTVNWLYTGDWRQKEVALGNADLAGHWPLQLREGDPAKYLDKNKRVPALGKAISVYGRPTLWLFDARAVAAATDNVVVHGTRIINSKVYPPGNNGWSADMAHQPDPFYAQYILSGEHWYLEQMQMWTASTALTTCPGTTGASYCRGPGAGIQDQVRGDAWGLRNRVNAAFITPDNDPQKAVFTEMVNDALALWEGQRDIKGTTLQSNPNWKFGYETAVTRTNKAYGGSRWGSAGISPLHFWEASNTGALANVGSITTGVTSPWMQNFVILELGRAAELGYPAKPLLEWLGPNLIGQLTDPGYNPYLVAAYRTPITKTGYINFNTWAEVLTGFDSTHQKLTTWPAGAYFPCASCYVFYARAALALAATLPGGDAAWKKMSQMIGDKSSVLNNEPQWALVPRSTNATLPAPGPQPHPRARGLP